MLHKASTFNTAVKMITIEDNMQWNNLFQSLLHTFHLSIKMTYSWVAKMIRRHVGTIHTNDMGCILVIIRRSNYL